MKDNYMLRLVSDLYLNENNINDKKMRETISNKFIENYQKVYNAVCLDIDNTVLEGDSNMSDDLITSFIKLLKMNIPICFITGRGENLSRDFMKNFISSIMMQNEFNTDMLENVFCYCYNGLLLGKYSFSNNKYIIYNCQKIYKEKNMLEFQESKKRLLNSILDKITTEIITLDRFGLNKRIIEHSGDKSFRIALNNAEIINYEELINTLKNIVTDFDNRFFLTKGIHKNMIVFEISLANKKNALKDFSKKIGIETKYILKIGDQGETLGNDYYMLNETGGFTVDMYDKFNPNNIIFPVYNRNLKKIKGTEATKFLLNNLFIFPSVCLQNLDFEYYKKQLAKSEKENFNKNKFIIEKYNEKVRVAFDNKITNIYDLFDIDTGGIILYDWELALIDENQKNNLYYTIFKKNSMNTNRKYCYVLQNDVAYILRGANSYYYMLSNNLYKNKIDRKFARDTIKIFASYIQEINNAFKIDLVYENTVLNRKMFLSVMDNIRNILLVLYNSIIQSIVQDENYLVNMNEEILNDYFKIIRENEKYLYKFSFYNISENDYKLYIKFVQQSVLNNYITKYNEFFNLLAYDYNFNYSKAFRVWREIDSFIENIMAMDDAINNYKIHNKENKKQINFYAMRYGAIELPFIVDILMENSNQKRMFQIISLKTKYSESHSKEAFSNYNVFNKSENCIFVKNENYENVILEDNILTGRTLQIAMNNFLQDKIKVDAIFLVRYPMLNRIPHMFIEEGHGAPNVCLFNKFIFGLVIPSPYSKVVKIVKRENGYDYKDELGIFNLTRKHVINYLYVNGIFKEGSEVSLVRSGNKNDKDSRNS